jgi:hypothetical protein
MAAPRTSNMLLCVSCVVEEWKGQKSTDDWLPSTHRNVCRDKTYMSGSKCLTPAEAVYLMQTCRDNHTHRCGKQSYSYWKTNRRWTSDPFTPTDHKNALQPVARPRCKPLVEQPYLRHARAAQTDCNRTTFAVRHHPTLLFRMIRPKECFAKDTTKIFQHYGYFFNLLCLNFEKLYRD